MTIEEFIDDIQDQKVFESIGDQILKAGDDEVFIHEKFANGRGVSVVRHHYSYGGQEGFFEIAVLDTYGQLDYTTEVTDDVIGWLKAEDVITLAKRVAQLA